MISLNYSVFLYNNNDKKHAQKQFTNFESKVKVLKGNANPVNTDPEVCFLLFVHFLNGGIMDQLYTYFKVLEVITFFSQISNSITSFLIGCS